MMCVMRLRIVVALSLLIVAVPNAVFAQTGSDRLRPARVLDLPSSTDQGGRASFFSRGLRLFGREEVPPTPAPNLDTEVEPETSDQPTKARRRTPASAPRLPRARPMVSEEDKADVAQNAGATADIDAENVQELPGVAVSSEPTEEPLAASVSDARGKGARDEAMQAETGQGDNVAANDVAEQNAASADVEPAGDEESVPQSEEPTPIVPKDAMDGEMLAAPGADGDGSAPTEAGVAEGSGAGEDGAPASVLGSAGSTVDPFSQRPDDGSAEVAGGHEIAEGAHTEVGGRSARSADRHTSEQTYETSVGGEKSSVPQDGADENHGASVDPEEGTDHGGPHVVGDASTVQTGAQPNEVVPAVETSHAPATNEGAHTDIAPHDDAHADAHEADNGHKALQQAEVSDDERASEETHVEDGVKAEAGRSSEGIDDGQSSDHADDETESGADKHAADDAHAGSETEQGAGDDESVPAGGDGDGKAAEKVEPLPIAPRPGLDAAALFRDLQSVQDRIAQGSTEALAEQRQVLDRIEVEFRKAAPETWQDPRNAVSLVGYVLSGGRPAVLRDILRSEPLPAVDEQLMRGALAYAEGRAQAAKEALAEVKARNFTSTGSQVAIAQAALVVSEDPMRAAALLDEARLLAPGTLAEEAALRREILVVAELQQVEKFALLSRQYLQRFRHSVYAGNFRQRFATALTRMKFVDNPEELPRLDDILSDMEPAARQELYLIIARAAVVQAKAPIARFAADRVLAMTDLSDTAKEQAHLYRAAVSVVGVETFDGASAALKKIDRNLLEEADRDLLDVVLGIADSIRRAPQVTLTDVAADRPADESAADANPASAAASPQAAELKDEFSQTNPTIARAQQAVEAADELLGGAQ